MSRARKATVYLEKQVWNYYVRRYYSHYGSNWTESFDPGGLERRSRCRAAKVPWPST